MRLAALLLLTGCAHAPLVLDATPATLDARSLEGTWRVVGSTFPMWLDGTRADPRFTYGPARTEAGRVVFRDTVSYLRGPADGEARGGQRETIEGFDAQHPTVPTHFTWSGLGALAAFTSEWDVVFLDARGRFAIITFSPTLATPAGLDVIAREPIDDEAWSDAVSAVASTPALASYATAVKRL